MIFTALAFFTAYSRLIFYVRRLCELDYMVQFAAEFKNQGKHRQNISKVCKKAFSRVALI